MKNKTTEAKIKNLWDDSHTLRGEAQITFGAAIEKYGAKIVKIAMKRGRVGVTWKVMLTPEQAGDVNAYAGMEEGQEKETIKATPRAYRHTDFDFAKAKPEMKMQANGEQIG